MLELTLRLIASLALVVGLLLVVVRLGGRRFQGRADAPVRVVHRQALSRGSAVAVLEIGGRVLVVGATDHQVSMLTELDPDDLSATEGTSAAAPFASALDSALDGALNGVPNGAVRELHVVPERETDTRTDTRTATDTDTTTALDDLLAPTGTDAAPAPTAQRRGGAHAARRSTRSVRPGEGGPLTGSVLSPDTWKQAVAAARGRR